MSKVVLFAFQGEAMCFVHVLLTAKDMHARGYEVRIVLEGAATALAKTLQDPAQPFAKLYDEVRALGVIDCMCKACGAKMEATEAAQAQGISLNGELAGHPSMARYMEEGFTVLTF